MRVATPITLSDSDKKTLEQNTRSRSVSVRLAERSQNSPVGGSGPGEQGDRPQAPYPTQQSRQVEKQIFRGWHDGNQ